LRKNANFFAENWQKSQHRPQVAFIGISNWALDPAKMNRGILLSRGVPDQNDLIKIAKGICAGNEDAARCLSCHKVTNIRFKIFVTCALNSFVT
jgi:hypothetical protein